MYDESDDNVVFLPLSLTLKPNADVDGFTVLAAGDANGDQVIDARDLVFSQLAVWRDLDGDGATDPGELQSLVQAGVAAIAATQDAGDKVAPARAGGCSGPVFRLAA